MNAESHLSCCKKECFRVLKISKALHRRLSMFLWIDANLKCIIETSAPAIDSFFCICLNRCKNECITRYYFVLFHMLSIAFCDGRNYKKHIVCNRADVFSHILLFNVFLVNIISRHISRNLQH